jgi:glycosyltransferase involved in cell wall biosynthesis
MLFVAHWDWVLFNFRLPVMRAVAAIGTPVAFVCPDGPYVAKLEAEGLNWHPWPLTRRGLDPLGELAAVRRLRQIYRRVQPRAVHHFTVKPNLYGSLAAHASGVPIVFNTFSGLGNFLAPDGAGPKALLGRTLGAGLRPALRSRRVWTITQTEDDRDRLISRGLAHPERITVIHGSGVDTDVFRPGPARPPGPVRVLMAARLLREKGVFELAEAARRLRDGAQPVEVLVAGEPDTGNPSSLTADDMRTLRESSPIQLLGHRHDTAELLRTVDIAVLPTYYPEGVPRFLLEAAATGLPLVATDLPGCRFAVRPDQNGVLVPPRDPAALADALATLAADPAMRQRFGAASRRLAVREFREDGVVQAHLDLYARRGALD